MFIVSQVSVGKRRKERKGKEKNLSSAADPGEVKWVNFHPPTPFSEPLLSFFSYPLNIEIICDFSDFLQKFTPHFKILDPRLSRSADKSVCFAWKMTTGQTGA